jgi:hypothetical protein
MAESFLRKRYQHAKLLLWRRLVASAMLVYGLLGGVAFLADQWLKAEWKLVDYAPSWSLWVWLAIGFALLFLLAIEGSLESTAKNKAAHDSELRDAENNSNERIQEATRSAQRASTELEAIKRDNATSASVIRNLEADRDRLSAELRRERDANATPLVSLDFMDGTFVLRNNGVDAFSVQINHIFLAPSRYMSFPFVHDLRSGEEKALRVNEIGPSRNETEPDDEPLLKLLLDGVSEDEGLVVKRSVVIDYTDRTAQPWISHSELTYDRTGRSIRMDFIGARPAPPTPQVLVQPDAC